MARRAGVPEWPKGAGCKPAGSAFGGSNPPPCIASRLATVSNHALLAQSVEHLHGKEGVDGSSPSEGSAIFPTVAGVAGLRVVGRGVGCPVMEPFWNRAGSCSCEQPICRLAPALASKRPLSVVRRAANPPRRSPPIRHGGRSPRSARGRPRLRRGARRCYTSACLRLRT